MSPLHRLPYASKAERPQAAGRATASWTHRGNATKRVEVIMPPEKLDELREAGAFDHVDFIKMDTQGPSPI